MGIGLITNKSGMMFYSRLTSMDVAVFACSDKIVTNYNELARLKTVYNVAV